jgi:hypothetical protein
MWMKNWKTRAEILTAFVVLTSPGLFAHQLPALGVEQLTSQKEKPNPVAEQSARSLLLRTRFQHLRELVKPQEGESKYLDEIPWVGTLWDARRKAAAEGKPIFVLATGYNALGLC